MALNKTIIDNRGVATSYHKIANLSIAKRIAKINNGDDETVIYNLRPQVASYISEEIRQTSEQLNVTITPYSLDCTYDELNTTPAFALAYAKLKDTEQFKDAIDV
jgi:hypothetical protein